jgi:DNA (cytosine-5)-methyltransferase 1
MTDQWGRVRVLLTHFSLFSGIGGIDLASEWAGFTTVGQVEIDDYCNKVLEKHWPDVPRWRDVRDVTRESVSARGIGRITLLSGGFPCQPHSCAGKRKASADERDLWGEFARVIRELEPRWVLAENVRGLLSSESGRFFGRVLRDLANMGYAVGWCCYGANAVGAPHQRERVFIVANAIGRGCREKRQQRSVGAIQGGQQDNTMPFKESSSNVADTEGFTERPGLCQGEQTEQRRGRSDDSGSADELADPNEQGLEKRFCGASGQTQDGTFKRQGDIHGWRPTQSRLGGRPDGIPGRLDFPGWPAGPEEEQHEWEPPRIAKGVKHRRERLKALGNAVVPAQIYPIPKAIADIERRLHA